LGCMGGVLLVGSCQIAPSLRRSRAENIGTLAGIPAVVGLPPRLADH
jgi:hypothetical protein